MLKILESQKHGADFSVALEAEPYFRKEAGRRSQGVGSGRGDSKAPCSTQRLGQGCLKCLEQKCTVGTWLIVIE